MFPMERTVGARNPNDTEVGSWATGMQRREDERKVEEVCVCGGALDQIVRHGPWCGVWILLLAGWEEVMGQPG